MAANTQKIKPNAHKNWLHFTAGVLWTGVGIMLSTMGIFWLLPFNELYLILFLILGVLLGLAIYKFGFSKLAKKNINRICGYENEKVCLFAFQEWKSYPLVLFMIALGIGLRKFSPIPKPYLAILYLGIGIGLLFSSLHYYWHLFDKKEK